MIEPVDYQIFLLSTSTIYVQKGQTWNPVMTQ